MRRWAAALVLLACAPAAEPADAGVASAARALLQQFEGR